MSTEQILKFKEWMHPTTISDIVMFRYFIKKLDEPNFAQEIVTKYLKDANYPTLETSDITLSLDKFIDKHHLIILKAFRNDSRAFLTEDFRNIQFVENLKKEMPLEVWKKLSRRPNDIGDKKWELGTILYNLSVAVRYPSSPIDPPF